MGESDPLISSFFSLSDPPGSFQAPRPQNEFRVKSPKKNISIEYKREEKGFEYAVKIREREENLLATQSLNMPSTSAAHDAAMSVDDGEDDEFFDEFIR